MKLMYWSIPCAVLASLCAAPVLAQPDEPACYLVTPYGEAFDLSPLCGTTAARYKSVPGHQQGQQAAGSRHGQVPQVGMQVYLSNGVWVTYGKVQNQTNQVIEGVRVTLEIADNGGLVQTQTTSVDQAFLRPGEIGSFQIGIRYDSVKQVEGQQLAVPAVRVAAVQWIYQDGTIGNYP